MLLPLFFSVFLISAANADTLTLRPPQSVGVKGKLTCNGEPAANILIKLYDKDTFTIDDKMAEGTTDANGQFEISGHANEISRIKPKLNIYHDCNDYLPCQRKVSLYVPNKFITEGEVPEKIYDMGSLELSAEFEGESRDCLHRK
ncbi:CRE-TTR-8 protein [Aphelenchoides avenae]|nr:CRE-TTR-8 protein [Aphelenchus avenae]